MLVPDQSSYHRTLFSVSADYFEAAEAELHAAFPRAGIERVGPDVGRIKTDKDDISAVAEVCRERPIVFVRHLMGERVCIPLADALDDPGPIVHQVTALVANHADSPRLALQIWSSGTSLLGYRSDDLWRAVATGLSERGFDVARANRDQIASICVSPGWFHLGFNRRSEALVDWPGGRISLAKTPDQISRSEFKLEELFKVFDIAPPADGVALDLGASPGGWTRILRRSGLSVWSVDPADLDPRISGDRAVHHVRTTAGPFLARTKQTFDVAVNDMRMEPWRSCRVMLEAAKNLQMNGLAIVTLKLSRSDPLGIVQESLRTLEDAYTIVHVRQLFHKPPRGHGGCQVPEPCPLPAKSQ